MGKVKELYMEMLYLTDNLPENITIEEIIKMKEEEIIKWRIHLEKEEYDNKIKK